MLSRLPEQRAAVLLHLIDQEGERRENVRRMVVAVPEVVPEVISVLPFAETSLSGQLPGHQPCVRRPTAHCSPTVKAVNERELFLPEIAAFRHRTVDT